MFQDTILNVPGSDDPADVCTAREMKPDRAAASKSLSPHPFASNQDKPLFPRAVEAAAFSRPMIPRAILSPPS
jgi:hypothetical protein